MMTGFLNKDSIFMEKRMTRTAMTENKFCIIQLHLASFAHPIKLAQ
jgi:hypothetical protein